MKSQIVIHGPGTSAALSDHASARFARALDPFAEHVVSAEIYLRSGQTVPRSTTGSVTARIRLRGRLTVTVEAVGDDLYQEARRASSRARRAVRRTVRRQQRVRKQSLRRLQYESAAPASA